MQGRGGGGQVNGHFGYVLGQQELDGRASKEKRFSNLSVHLVLEPV